MSQVPGLGHVTFYRHHGRYPTLFHSNPPSQKWNRVLCVSVWRWGFRYIYMYVYTYVCLYVCMYVYITATCTHTHIMSMYIWNMCVQYKHVYTHTHSHTHTQPAQTDTDTNTNRRIYIHPTTSLLSEFLLLFLVHPFLTILPSPPSTGTHVFPPPHLFESLYIWTYFPASDWPCYRHIHARGEWRGRGVPVGVTGFRGLGYYVAGPLSLARRSLVARSCVSLLARVFLFFGQDTGKHRQRATDCTCMVINRDVTTIHKLKLIRERVRGNTLECLSTLLTTNIYTFRERERKRKREREKEERERGGLY